MASVEIIEIVEVPAGLPERLSWRSQADPRSEILPMPQALRSSSGATKNGARPLRFAVYSEEPDVHELGDVTAKHLAFKKFSSYAELVDALAEGDVDLAWLPPVAYVRAARVGAARLLLTLERDGRRSYSAAIVARRDEAKDLAYLSGRRAAWVDPWSAAGYLVPRAMLRETGMNPDALLHGQSFYGSYAAVVEALLGKQADIGAMHCLLDDRQRIVRDGWGTHPELVAIAVSAQPIPGDTITAAAGVSESRLRRGVAALLRVGGTERGRYLLRRVFGTDRFVVGNPSRYADLDRALADDVRRREGDFTEG